MRVAFRNSYSGATLSRTDSAVTTQRTTSLRPGTSNIASNNTASRIERSPRAPVPALEGEVGDRFERTFVDDQFDAVHREHLLELLDE